MKTYFQNISTKEDIFSVRKYQINIFFIFQYIGTYLNKTMQNT